MLAAIRQPPAPPAGLPPAADIVAVVDALERFFAAEKTIRQFFTSFSGMLTEHELNLRKYGTLANIEADAAKMGERLAHADAKRAAADEVLADVRKQAAGLIAKAEAEANAVRIGLEQRDQELKIRAQVQGDKERAFAKMLAEREAACAKTEASLSVRESAVASREAAVSKQIEKMTAAGIKIEL